MCEQSGVAQGLQACIDHRRRKITTGLLELAKRHRTSAQLPEDPHYPSFVKKLDGGIDGSLGIGKSVIVYAIVCFARAEGWVVSYMVIFENLLFVS